MLLLTSFAVENFRGIRHGTVSGLTDVNVIIGRNNSGKTTLLEAIHLSLTHFASQDQLGRDIKQFWLDARKGIGTEFEQMLQGAKYQSEVTAQVLVNGRVKTALVRASGNRLRYMSGGPTLDLQGFDGDGEAQNRFIGATNSFKEKAMCFRPPDTSNTGIESKLWPQLLTDRSDKRLAAALNDVFGTKAESFQLLPSGKLIVLFENHSVPLDAQGDGTRAAMRCLMLLTALKQTLFIMEEPECHQHPGSLEKFALAVCKLAKQNEVQLMISTHSGECVKAFLKAAEAAQSGSAVFHLSLTDGIQTARRLDAKAVDTLQGTGIDVRFLDLYS